MAQTMQKEVQKYPKTNADDAAPYTGQTDVQHTALIEQDMAELITLRTFVGAQAERHQEILAERSTEHFMTCTKMLMKQRCQQIIVVWLGQRLSTSTLQDQ